MELATLFKSDCEALVDFHGATYREGQVAVILEYMVSAHAIHADALRVRALACLAAQPLPGVRHGSAACPHLVMRRRTWAGWTMS